MRNHILIFKNPMELLDKDAHAPNQTNQCQNAFYENASPLISKKHDTGFVSKNNVAPQS